MAEGLSERQQRAAERILEDESLTEDLTDAPARALINWASEQASILAGDDSRDDEQLSAALTALRKAVRTAAASGENDPEALIAQAQAALTQALKPTSSDTSATNKATPSASKSQPVDSEAAPSEPSILAKEEQKAHSTDRQKPKGKDQPKDKTKEEHPSEARREQPKQTSADEEVSTAPRQSRQPLHVPEPPARSRVVESHINNAEDQSSVEARYTNWLEDITDGERE